jgi:hypothetical protein
MYLVIGDTGSNSIEMYQTSEQNKYDTVEAANFITLGHIKRVITIAKLFS